ncbi:Na(+)-translocating NADH-quinone reductase subunit C [Shewanella sp. NIFS-20-20]|uniref:Na(+)-translocating NADH-quinone reductase subunit C n=1 Tax=Shewanella sp. NIFS-20-20 TaxID=2853806 RepID=UPI001C44D5F3|nr:Na(+)-translocating NADH-quinone reductase subunit C [Shewanella sp. NIFS-20-20]MBV7317180.1 Na(+)-translocating NADH-quinone reductase subunit C [Shewanella sp. NIFS-20-20]
MAFNKDSVLGTMVFTISLCLVCSFMITGTAEVLKERKLVKKRDELQRNVLMAANIQLNGQDVREVFASQVTPMLVALDSGEIVPQAQILDFDERMAAINPETSSKPKKDTAKIRSRADAVRVFEVRDGSGKLDTLVVPIYGKGLWSMMYGYVALESDLNTIRNLVFYEHGETPGIADFVTDPHWLAQFTGKQLFDDKGKVAIKIIKGGAPQGNVHGIDAVSGATATGRGIQRTFEFWFGKEGFAPYFDKLTKAGA